MILLYWVYRRMKSAICENSVNSTLGKFAKLRRIGVIRATIIPMKEKSSTFFKIS